MSNFKDVGEFHKKFGLPFHDNASPFSPHLIGRDLVKFRVKFLLEEMKELVEAYDADDLPGIADALIDLVYVALGTAHMHHLPWEQLFAEVQRANMTKERVSRAEDSKRGSSFDVCKPDGWMPPDIHAVLKAAGWDS